MTLCWEKLEDYRTTFVSDVEFELEQTLEVLNKSAPTHLPFAVIGAHLARQVNFAIQFARNPSLWTVHLAPGFLRCMYELNVRLMWLIEDPEPNCKGFIKASVKETEAIRSVVKNKIQSEPTKDQFSEADQALEEWLNHQSSTYATDGAAKVKDLRKMAEKLKGEALKMYRLYNSSLSPSIHSSWNFIEPICLQHSTNPLHRYVRIPRLPSYDPQPDYLLSVCFFADQSIQIVRGTDLEDESAFGKLLLKVMSPDSNCEHVKTEIETP